MTHDPEITREMKRQHHELRKQRKVDLAANVLAMVGGASETGVVSWKQIDDHEEELYWMLGHIHEAFESTERSAIYTTSSKLHSIIFLLCMSGTYTVNKKKDGGVQLGTKA